MSYYKTYYHFWLKNKINAEVHILSDSLCNLRREYLYLVHIILRRKYSFFIEEGKKYWCMNEKILKFTHHNFLWRHKFYLNISFVCFFLLGVVFSRRSLIVFCLRIRALFFAVVIFFGSFGRRRRVAIGWWSRPGSLPLLVLLLVTISGRLGGGSRAGSASRRTVFTFLWRFWTAFASGSPFILIRRSRTRSWAGFGSWSRSWSGFGSRSIPSSGTGSRAGSASGSSIHDQSDLSTVKVIIVVFVNGTFHVSTRWKLNDSAKKKGNT